MSVELLSENEAGKTYQADGFRVYYRVAGHVAGDNDENVREYVHLISGIADVRIAGKSHKLEAPSIIEIPEKTQHTITATTDVTFIITHPDEEVV
jgi:glyoxylate utilization-related uncharacterized protein